ncbi:VanZ family protein [Kitasatospora sp. NPDC003701]
MAEQAVGAGAGDGTRAGHRRPLTARLRRGRTPQAADAREQLAREPLIGERLTGEPLTGEPPAGDPPGQGAPLRERRSWAATLGRWLALLVAFLMMVAFAVVLARVTLVAVPGAVGRVHSNVRPGDSLRHYLLHATTVDAIRQVGGNVLLGAPFGLLLPVLWPRARGLFRVLIRTAAVMLLVELVQGALVTGRAFDIDDVVLNTTGALLGYLLVGRRLARTVHRRPRQPLPSDKALSDQGN